MKVNSTNNETKYDIRDNELTEKIEVWVDYELKLEGYTCFLQVNKTVCF